MTDEYTVRKRKKSEGTLKFKKNQLNKICLFVKIHLLARMIGMQSFCLDTHTNTLIKHSGHTSTPHTNTLTIMCGLLKYFFLSFLSFFLSFFWLLFIFVIVVAAVVVVVCIFLVMRKVMLMMMAVPYHTHLNFLVFFVIIIFQEGRRRFFRSFHQWKKLGKRNRVIVVVVVLFTYGGAAGWKEIVQNSVCSFDGQTKREHPRQDRAHPKDYQRHRIGRMSSKDLTEEEEEEERRK